jgi:hypothetical protein
MKLSFLLKSSILESKNLADFPGYITPAAIEKEKEIGNKSVKPEDAIEDLDLNTLNRNHTIKEYGYGPLNPGDTSTSEIFWKQKAELWNTTVEHAKTSRCKNCAAFDQSKDTLNKIEKALGKDGKKINQLANLGFCELFWFKCAGDRTCDAWLMGGPLK